MNLVQFLEETTRKNPDETMFVDCGEKTTYRELWNRVDRLAKVFLGLGIADGGKVAVCLPNSIEYLYCFLAALKINAIAVPLHQHMTLYELQMILDDCRPAALVADDLFLKKVVPDEYTVPDGVVLLLGEKLLDRENLLRALSLNDLINASAALGTTFPAEKGTSASINYTYRGYGYPLGAMMTHGNFFSGIDTYVRTTGCVSRMNVLLALPLSHIYPLVGCVLAPLATSSAIINVREFDPQNILKIIETHKVEVVTAVPTLYAFLLKLPGGKIKRLASVKESFCGASLLPQAVYDRIKAKTGMDLRQGYGLTECLPVTCNPGAGNRPETVGKAGHGVKIRISGSPHDAGTGAAGEILVGGDSVMSGYYNHPAETADVLRDGWCATGDLGYFDASGYLHFCGVKKQTTKVAGKIVDLVEVENLMLSFPGIDRVDLRAENDELWGSVLAADVSVRQPEDFNVVMLKAHLRERLSSYKIPRIKVVGH